MRAAAELLRGSKIHAIIRRATVIQAQHLQGLRAADYATYIATSVVVIAALYFGREVFMPIAIALLLTFALAPVVSKLRKMGIPRVAAVIASVLGAFAALGLFSFIVVMQVGELASNVSTYQTNILSKISSLKDAGAGAGVIKKLSSVIERVGREIQRNPLQSPARSPNQNRSRRDRFQPKPIEVLRADQRSDKPACHKRLSLSWSFSCFLRGRIWRSLHKLAGYGDLHRTLKRSRTPVVELGFTCSCSWW